MTQTSIPAGTLASLLTQAYDLHSAIAAAMNTIENKTGTTQPEQWDELHIAMQAAGIASGQLHQMSRRQRAADEPVPYTLADEITIELARHCAFGPCDCGATHTLPEAVALNEAGQ